MGLSTWWIRWDLRRYLAAVAAMPPGERQQVSDAVYMRAAELRLRRETAPASSWVPWLRDRLGEDTRQHRAARTAGARSRRDPRWLRTAILRAWTRLLIHEARGMIAGEAVLQVEEAIAAALWRA